MLLGLLAHPRGLQVSIRWSSGHRDASFCCLLLLLPGGIPAFSLAFRAVCRAAVSATGAGFVLLIPHFSHLLSSSYAGSGAGLPTFSLDQGSAGSGSTHAEWPAAVAHGSCSTSVQAGQGAYASLPGLGSVPPKLVKRIQGKEYIDIGELLPETWQLESENTCCHSKRPRRSLVTDISLWTECYATMAAILAATFPEKAPQFFMYLRTITKASRNFEGAAWASYDMAFRRQAANRGSLDWGCVDPALYNEAFAGRAKVVPRCRYCLADTHSSLECPHSPGESFGGPTPVEGRPARPLPRSLGSSGRPAAAVEICRLYNSPGGPRCRFPLCRYAHLCSRCRRPHPLSECGDRLRQQQSVAPAGGQATPQPAGGGPTPPSTA